MPVFSHFTSVILLLAEYNISAFNEKLFAVNKYIRELITGMFIYSCNGSSGNTHLSRAIFLSKTLKINQSDCFIFI